LINKILEAPVGQVANVLGKVLDGNILLQIIEQSTVSPHHFERKVTISSNQLPVIKAQVKFDSRQLPKFILDELLKKKQGIGSILTQNNISATRRVLSLNKDLGQSKTTREYQILVDGTVWFTIYEEIRLDNLGSSDNSRTTPR
jgi:chorismate-pyruvate lyase